MQKSEECVEEVGFKGLGSYFSNKPLDFSLRAPVIYFVCNQPGPLTFFSFELCPYTLLQIFFSDHVVTSLWQIQQTAKIWCCFAFYWQSSHMWKAGESIPQVASPSRSPVLSSLRVAWGSRRVQETFNSLIIFLPDCVLLSRMSCSHTACSEVQNPLPRWCLPGWFSYCFHGQSRIPSKASIWLPRKRCDQHFCWYPQGKNGGEGSSSALIFGEWFLMSSQPWGISALLCGGVLKCRDRGCSIQMLCAMH